MGKILIYGWYGYRNIGDELILLNMINSLSQAIPKVEFTVFSNDPEYIKKTHNANSINYAPFSLKGIIAELIFNPRKMVKALWELAKTDLLVIGGGGFLTDWGVNLKHWLPIIKVAKLLNKPVMIYGVGVHSLKTPQGKRIAQKYLSMVDVITVRDEESKEWIEKLGLAKIPVILTADPAIQTQSLIDNNIQQTNDKELKVGLTLTYWFNKPSLPNYDIEKYQLFKKNIKRILESISEHPNIKIIMIPMQQRSPNIINQFSDINFLNELIKEIGHRDNIQIISDNTELMDSCRLFGTLDVLFAMHLHANIIASTFSVPMIGLIYDPKVERFLNRIGMGGYAFNVEDIAVENFDIKGFMENFNYIVDNRQVIQEQIKLSVDKLKAIENSNAQLAAKLINR